ncbi:UNKNOWN [Stylonychia lemnae]|uniref:Uncharacterized protein n=1 Tax=Stylonychia lemnae TaxID=5949 RepID=A0A078AWZ5_STYLE|nr:UNKNOWN [Stylonychia lemnae]|eukprot:CDW86960.1 UNKNOWN [Stylonychia lemnae]
MATTSIKHIGLASSTSSTNINSTPQKPHLLSPRSSFKKDQIENTAGIYRQVQKQNQYPSDLISTLAEVDNESNQMYLNESLARTVRVSIAIKNTDKVRPVLMLVDKENDTIISLGERIRTKFGIKQEALINRLLLQSGEVIDDIGLIEKNDKIQVELIKNNSIQTGSEQQPQISHINSPVNVNSSLNTLPSTQQILRNTEDTIQSDDFQPVNIIDEYKSRQVRDAEEEGLANLAKFDVEYPRLVANIPAQSRILNNLYQDINTAGLSCQILANQSERVIEQSIPRGDITLQDRTLQITLYCHQYGKKRNRMKELERGPNGSFKIEDGQYPDYSRGVGSQAGYMKQDGRCQSKKSNCPFRLKFTKQVGKDYFEFFQAIHYHNHPLIIGQKTKNHSNYHKKNSNGDYSLQQKYDNIKEEPIDHSSGNLQQSHSSTQSNQNSNQAHNQKQQQQQSTSFSLQLKNQQDKINQQQHQILNTLKKGLNDKQQNLQQQEKVKIKQEGINNNQRNIQKSQNEDRAGRYAIKSDFENEYEILRYSQHVRKSTLKLNTTFSMDLNGSVSLDHNDLGNIQQNNFGSSNSTATTSTLQNNLHQQQQPYYMRDQNLELCFNPLMCNMPAALPSLRTQTDFIPTDFSVSDLENHQNQKNYGMMLGGSSNTVANRVNSSNNPLSYHQQQQQLQMEKLNYHHHGQNNNNQFFL